MEFNEYAGTIERKLQRSFDIARDHSISGIRYDLFAEFRMRNEKFILSKKAVIYAFENNEYCLMRYMPELAADDAAHFTDDIVRAVVDLVKPDGEHMSSVLTGVLVFGDGREDTIVKAAEEVRRFRYHRSFSLGFRGWVDIRLLLVSLEGGVIAANKRGEQVSKVYGI